MSHPQTSWIKCSLGAGLVQQKTMTAPNTTSAPSPKEIPQMTDRFDPNIPPAGPTDPSIEGEFTGIVALLEKPTLGKSNLVVNQGEAFDISCSWHVFGNLV